ncbi:MAG: tRNA-dihydrouridine synthase family protein [Treponemataceae bacterium]|nr:tRNA-dihydrouridine synthase family protein [Treponemataceae bacterium]
MPKLLFAPMATLSHEAMRRLIEHYSPNACDEYYTEMIQATTFIGGGKFEQFYVRPGPAPERVVWQLTCGKAEPMAEAAKIIGALGGIGIDINMGCCAPEIVRQGAGIAWMLKDNAETQQMLRMVRNAVPLNMRLSVKMRLGDEDYNMKKLCNFVDMLVSEGVPQIVLHPRTKKAKFKRPPHWNDAETLFEYVQKKYDKKISCCINGDIVDFESLNNVQKFVPLSDGFMIGRAAVQKPWLFGVLSQKLQGIIPEEKSEQTVDSMELVKEFLVNLKECQPEDFWMTRAARFFAYFCNNFGFAHYLFTQINNAKDLDGMEQAFSAYLEKMPGERFLNIYK